MSRRLVALRHVRRCIVHLAQLELQARFGSDGDRIPGAVLAPLLHAQASAFGALVALAPELANVPGGELEPGSPPATKRPRGAR